MLLSIIYNNFRVLCFKVILILLIVHSPNICTLLRRKFSAVEIRLIFLLHYNPISRFYCKKNQNEYTPDKQVVKRKSGV